MGSTTTQPSVQDPHMSERAMLRRFFDSAIDSVSAARVMPRSLPSPQHGRVALIAVGKAAAAMADVALDRIPALGQDSVAILSEIGYGDDEIETLRRNQVI